MRPPPCLCSLAMRMAVKYGICGVLDAEVSFDYCIVMMSGYVVCMRCCSSSTVLLMPFALSRSIFISLCFVLEVLCFVCDSVRVWVMEW